VKIKFKKRYGLIGGAAAACALFLMLPVVFSDDIASPRAPAAVDGDEGSSVVSLPVIVSENSLAKYLRKAGDFYGLTKKPSAAFGRTRGVLPPAPEDNYTDEERAEIFASYARERIAQRTNPQQPRQDGEERQITVQPDEKGYYYEGRYYKNGTYPTPELKKQIENSITKFHAAQAEKQGKKAAYVLQYDGSLWVKYMPQVDLDKKLNALSAELIAGEGGALYAYGNIYDGARIVSKKESGRASSGGRSEDISADISRYEIFNKAERKIAEIQNASRAQQQQQQAQQPPAQKPTEKPSDKPEGGRGGNNDAAKLLGEIGNVNKRLLQRLDRKPSEQPIYDPDKFGKSPVYLDYWLSRNLNISEDDFAKDENGDSYFSGFVYRAGAEDFVKDSKVFFSSYREGLNKMNEEGLVFANFVNVPPYDPDNPNDKNLSFSYTDMYYEGTGLKKILTEQMGINKEKIQEIEQSYAELDKGRALLQTKKAEFFEKYPGLKDLNVEFYYIIGKEGNNVLVATIKSPWYATTPDAVPAGPEYHPQGEDAKSYTAVPVENLQKALTNPHAITVPFMVRRDADPVHLPWGQKATSLNLWELESPFPKDLEKIQAARGEALLENMQGKIDQQAEYALKQEMQKAKKAAAAKKKADEETKKQKIKAATEKINKAAGEVVGPPVQPKNPPRGNWNPIGWLRFLSPSTQKQPEDTNFIGPVKPSGK
jgi:hypothetical protein